MDNQSEVQHIFIIGSKGIPAHYGGFETFVDKLTEYSSTNSLMYHVACLQDDSNGKDDDRFVHNGSDCFVVGVPKVGSARVILYDIAALQRSLEIIESENIKYPIIYVLASRIGPFIKYFKKKIERIGGRLYINPDGHEFLRAKWNAAIKAYWRFSERLMVKHADLVICDSWNIEQYIKANYKQYNPETCFIAYGAEMEPSRLADDDPQVVEWFASHNIRLNEYYVNIARIVPENNYRTIVQEFMESTTDKDLVIIANLANNTFYNELKSKLDFEADSRVKFVGGIYNQELLKKIRSNAYGYIHGHSVGGTNPSLLEALGNVDMCLLYDVGFNREVAEDTALYWDLNKGSLAEIIMSADAMDTEERCAFGRKARQRMNDMYNWRRIAGQYKEIFL